jgi:hypothetical protein
MSEHEARSTPSDSSAYAEVTFDGSIFVGSNCVVGFPKEEPIRRHLTEGIAISELAQAGTHRRDCIIGNHVVIHEGTSSAPTA